ncbi:FMN-dependent NADH-azoreductase [Legionella sp. W05-934-2]|uniref:FMN-dependent NADH-azoreductase n=1 Tax=Legionella sp. W05-934-2 TaxID=1198649 RepID=UPI003462B20F
MKTLAIDSSMMGQQSISRQMMRYFLETEDSNITYRDLVKDSPAHLSLELMVNQVPTDATAYQISLSKDYLDEFMKAERVVIAAPMYNFSIPSVLKSWIDRILVAGQTFKYTEHGPVGLAGNKQIIVLSSRGSEFEFSPELKAMDHQESYLKTVFNFIGISDITFIRAEGVNMGEDKKQAAITKAFYQIDTIFRKSVVELV